MAVANTGVKKPTSGIRLAALCTEARPNSHADAIVGRWLAPFPSDAAVGWSHPTCEIVSIYCEQRHPQRDLLPAWKDRFGIQIFPTIRDALTLGGHTLAVDGVLLIAEHGDYPENDCGQKLYPRKEFFDETLRVFDQSGKVVPVFFDKHLSWNPEWIMEMWKAVEEREIPFFAGSSIPLTANAPKDSMPSTPCNSAALYFGGLESYLFHAAELVESLGWGLSEGSCKVTVAEGEEAWRAIHADPDAWELLLAAAASANAQKTLAELREERHPGAVLFSFVGEGGQRVRYFREPDRIRKWAAASQSNAGTKPLAVCADVRATPGFHQHFAKLCAGLDSFFQRGASFPGSSRILRSSLITAHAMQSRATGLREFHLP